MGRFWENLRISWEHIGNMMGTRKEMPKISFPPHPTPSQKGQNWTPHESILSLSLAAWKLLFPKRFAAIKSGASLTPTSRGKIPPTLNPPKYKGQQPKNTLKSRPNWFTQMFLGVIFYHRMVKLLLTKLGRAQASQHVRTRS